MKKLNKTSIKNTPNSYSNYIPFDALKKKLEAIKKIKNRIQYEVFGKLPDKKDLVGEVQLIIDDAKSLKKFIKTELHSNIETPMEISHISLLLLCCKNSKRLEEIEYLIKQSAEIHRTSILSENALMFMFKIE